MITRGVDPRWAGNIDISDFASVELPVRSIIRTAKIATLQEDRILGTIGHLGGKEIQQVTPRLDKRLGR